jgi:hydroxymethylbilane synthase
MATDTRRTFVLASRASTLAKIQTEIVQRALERTHPDNAFGTSFMSTQGDKNQSQALYLIGDKALWTKELEVALLDGTVDMLVHSLKDVPTTLPPGCVLAGFTEREDPVDSLVVKEGLLVDGRPVRSLADLPAGAVIGTSSVRRVAQLRRQFPGFVFQDVVRVPLSRAPGRALTRPSAYSPSISRRPSAETCAYRPPASRASIHHAETQ